MMLGLPASGRLVGAVPLADAGPAGVGQHDGAERLEVGEQTVAVDRGAHLLGAGGDHELGLDLEAFGCRLASDARRHG